MKVLQSLGVHGATQQAAVFQYKRTPTHVVIESVPPGQVLQLDHDEWIVILQALASTGVSVLPLSGPNSLNALIIGALPGRGLTPSDASKIAAILEHEGSIDHYGGVVGQGQSVAIHLRRDF